MQLHRLHQHRSAIAMETFGQWGWLTRQPSFGLLFGFHLLCCCMQKIICSTNTIYPTQPLTGNNTITSSGGIFELGYFPLGNPARYYIGIWYKDIPVDNVVWVANRERPLPDKTAEFKISEDGNLVLQTQSGPSVVWSTSLNPRRRSSTMVAVLLDSGNLVLRDKNSSAGTVVWDSFRNPTDSWLPGQIFGINKVTKQVMGNRAWKNLQDPSPGYYSNQVDPNGTAQIIMLWNNTRQYFTTGIWDGHIFSALPEMRGRPINFSYVTNDTVSYFTYSFYSSTIIARFKLDHTGQIKLFIGDKKTSQWVLFWVRPTEYQTCEVYGLCGAFGVCTDQGGLKLNPCQCIDGFEPASAKNWELNDWTDGCIRKNKLQCAGDQFSSLQNMRAPGKSDATTALASAQECKSACLKDCSCTSYSYEENKCSTWRGDLFNLQQLSQGSGDHIYIRVAGLQTATNEATKKQPTPVVTEASTGGGRSQKRTRVLILTIPLVAVVCIAMGAYCFRRRNAKKRGEPYEENLAAAIGLGEEGDDNGGPALPLYKLRALLVATNDFSESNKLGEGGFGAVYKGDLSGEQVAVKRLSKDSKQGVEEFVNEVKLIAKLQHRNLVQLIGCCVEKEEKILVYEYMPNKSLDTFIFGDESLRRQLEWEKRFEIVMGIARGLQYLHTESRLRVIHRDLKGSNILLDGEMNPKISDFGLARIFDGDQSQVNTHRVVGTYGYMPPEYALEGRYSIKSDVYSFGVIVLEIVSGQRMTRFQDLEHSLNLLGHAWKLWNEGKAEELLDRLLGTPSNLDHVMRCINVGLLCVEEDAADRPNMASICLMLSGDPAVLPAPKHPAYSKATALDASSPPIGSEPTTTPISAVEAR